MYSTNRRTNRVGIRKGANANRFFSHPKEFKLESKLTGFQCLIYAIDVTKYESSLRGTYIMTKTLIRALTKDGFMLLACRLYSLINLFCGIVYRTRLGQSRPLRSTLPHKQPRRTLSPTTSNSDIQVSLITENGTTITF